MDSKSPALRRQAATALAVASLVATTASVVTEADDAAAIGEWGVALESIDASVRPGDDFFRYVNGSWLEEAEIPADMPHWGYGVKLHLQAEAAVRQVIAELSEGKHAPGSVEQKVGDLYASWMDVERLDQLGATPLQPHLQAIAAISDREELVEFFGDIHHPAPFAVGILPDPADTARYAVIVEQAGLGMPGRDYYLDDSKRFGEYRAAYRVYIADMLELAGVPDADRKAEGILALETRLAQAHWPPEESRDVRKIYNPMGIPELQALVPQFNWSLIFSRIGLGDVETFIVAQTTALQETGKIFVDTPLDTWKDYLAFHFINGKASILSSAFDQASFRFYLQTLNGVAEQREREKRGVQLINGTMGEAVGQAYVNRFFPAESKARVEELVGNLTGAFRERLENNPWMDETTRRQALVKLGTFDPRVGYPEEWTDYSSLKIDRHDLFGNHLALQDFQWQLQLDRLDGPVDRSLWAMTPQTVNAYYSPLMNQITFPAAILQPPMFDPNADPAANYGAIGAVIGHEIGHGFDDQGRRFDEMGRIRDWWTPESNARFIKRVEKLSAQYAQYEPVDGAHINSALTAGENIGDLGGVEMAYAAYHRHLDRCCDGKAPVIDGLTGDQRFFIAYAAGWQRIAREDYLRKELKTDPHSPAEFRVNGVVRNIDAWYRAFDVRPGDALYLAPEERVHIW